jgi:hypothetical protein
MNDIERRIEIVMGMCREKIPVRFYRTFEDRPFDTCGYCHKSIRVENTWYLIMKYYAEHELKAEIAICNDCSSELKQGYSEESKLALRKIYSNEYVNRRLQILFQAEEGDDKTTLMTSKCAICNEDREFVSEYFEYAHCVGEAIVFYTGPSMICDRCTMKIYDSLSSQTKDHKSRFFQKHFGFPPPGTNLEDPVDREFGFWHLV